MKIGRKKSSQVRRKIMKNNCENQTKSFVSTSLLHKTFIFPSNKLGGNRNDTIGLQLIDSLEIRIPQRILRQTTTHKRTKQISR